jgi:mono/diheme cytochrome c family protein
VKSVTIKLPPILALLAAAASATGADVPALVEKYCVECHDADAKKGGLDLDAVLGEAVGAHPAIWEKVVRRLEPRQMPPAKEKLRPTEAEYAAILASLTGPLDAAARAQPRPGRTETIRRLTRTEYRHAVRDLLALDVDADALLPPDEASHGFDNVTVGTLSPTLLDRYLTAAQKISRLALGAESRGPGGERIRIPPDRTQEERAEGLPWGTRGGALIAHTFPRDGEYEIAIRLTRDRNDEVEGLREPHELLVLLDGAPVRSFTVKPPAQGEGHNDIDRHLHFRLAAKAGPRALGVTFLKNPASLLEYKRQPYEARFNFHRHPRTAPAIYQVSIDGPHGASAAGDTPSRRRILCAPDVERALATLLRCAWRRPVAAGDIARFTPLLREAQSLEAGLEAALSAILVSREFLFRVEAQPAGLAAGAVYSIGEIELASRLSFFLWSSIPDEELLALAERGELRGALAAQTRRMLADSRAASLVTHFAAQWLHLRNLDAFAPDGRLFPDWDDNLRRAMRRETELLFAEILREDRSILDLLQSDHAYLNERLAKHYGIPHLYGAHFRRVALAPGTPRGGLLRHAGVLAVTSYATRTAPTLRGKWILENLLGTPPPPLPIRQRLAAHRDKPACAGCHDFIDPPGFALEHYDAVGRWRALEAGQPVDARGGLPDGSEFAGVEGLERALLARPDLFARTLTEKLLVFALGRGLEPGDAPAVRAIVRAAAANDYRFSSIVLALVESVPFQMREAR